VHALLRWIRALDHAPRSIFASRMLRMFFLARLSRTKYTALPPRIPA
jgi:hypothetical protein